jgi:5'-deoxynucleotidase YfbR-like HD superfamily hydrolase
MDNSIFDKSDDDELKEYIKANTNFSRIITRMNILALTDWLLKIDHLPKFDKMRENIFTRRMEEITERKPPLKSYDIIDVMEEVTRLIKTSKKSLR